MVKSMSNTEPSGDELQKIRGDIESIIERNTDTVPTKSLIAILDEMSVFVQNRERLAFNNGRNFLTGLSGQERES